MTAVGDLDIEAFRAAAHRAADWIADYLKDIEERPVLPRVVPGDVRRALPEHPPRDGEPLDAILDDFESLLVPATTQWNSPGFMAYFASSGSAPGILGELLAAGLNANAMLWRTGPAQTELEQVALDWLRQILGLPEPLFGVINDTASSSTLYALAAARDAAGDAAAERGGVNALPPMRIYASAEAHSSVAKATMVLGLGRDGLRAIPVDAELRMDPAALEDAIAEDTAAGLRPCAVVATAGTTSTTSVDPIPAVADVCARRGLWLHVDAAYAGAAAAAPEYRWVLDGAERADSIVVNPHKWLFTPMDCSVLWTGRPLALRSAFSLVPEYLRTAEAANPDAIDLMDYGVSLGRRFRALKLWMVLRAFGSDGIASRVREHCRFAELLSQWVRGSPDFELLAPAPLSVVCLRAHPAGVDGDAELDALNESIVDRVNSSGRFFISHTRVRGVYAIRVAFGNLRATEAHVHGIWNSLRNSLSARKAM
ncbi:MAG: amino acid decarboxylase [Chloroflexi bacterium]|nr:MAG: amino acid decarboxylase [Chloroflexota bacterium]